MLLEQVHHFDERIGHVHRQHGAVEKLEHVFDRNAILGVEQNEILHQQNADDLPVGTVFPLPLRRLRRGPNGDATMALAKGKREKRTVEARQK